MITSAQNRIIKDIKALSKKKDRVKSGLFIAEGLRFVESAIEAGAHIEYIVYSTSVFRTTEGKILIDELLRHAEINVVEVDEKLMAELSDTQSPQGILAIVHQPKSTWSDLIKDKGLIVILDRIQDPGNLGTILRTSDAAGATGLVLLKGTVDLYNPKVLRSTMGSIFSIPVIEGVEWDEACSKLKESGFVIAATALENSVEYDSVDYRGATALVIGNEANGISDAIFTDADFRVKIPIVGSAESLNAGVAASIMVYEVLRQRK